MEGGGGGGGGGGGLGRDVTDILYMHVCIAAPAARYRAEGLGSIFYSVPNEVYLGSVFDFFCAKCALRHRPPGNPNCASAYWYAGQTSRALLVMGPSPAARHTRVREAE
jgi:hypothetical protein